MFAFPVRIGGRWSSNPATIADAQDEGLLEPAPRPPYVASGSAFAWLKLAGSALYRRNHGFSQRREPIDVGDQQLVLIRCGFQCVSLREFSFDVLLTKIVN